jgi:hypothetical protein
MYMSPLLQFSYSQIFALRYRVGVLYRICSFLLGLMPVLTDNSPLMYLSYAWYVDILRPKIGKVKCSVQSSFFR